MKDENHFNSQEPPEHACATVDPASTHSSSQSVIEDQSICFISFNFCQRWNNETCFKQNSVFVRSPPRYFPANFLNLRTQSIFLSTRDCRWEDIAFTSLIITPFTSTSNFPFFRWERIKLVIS